MWRCWWLSGPQWWGRLWWVLITSCSMSVGVKSHFSVITLWRNSHRIYIHKSHQLQHVAKLVPFHLIDYSSITLKDSSSIINVLSIFQLLCITWTSSCSQKYVELWMLKCSSTFFHHIKNSLLRHRECLIPTWVWYIVIKLPILCQRPHVGSWESCCYFISHWCSELQSCWPAALRWPCCYSLLSVCCYFIMM